MALELPLYHLPGFTAPASTDLSAYQYSVVTINDEGEVALCGNTGLPIGVLQNAPDEGEQAEVMVAGLTKVQFDDGADSDATAGDLIAITSVNGTVAEGNDATAANVANGDTIVGQAYKDVSVGAIGSMVFSCLNPNFDVVA